MNEYKDGERSGLIKTGGMDVECEVRRRIVFVNAHAVPPVVPEVPPVAPAVPPVAPVHLAEVPPRQLSGVKAFAAATRAPVASLDSMQSAQPSAGKASAGAAPKPVAPLASAAAPVVAAGPVKAAVAAAPVVAAAPAAAAPVKADAAVPPKAAKETEMHNGRKQSRSESQKRSGEKRATGGRSGGRSGPPRVPHAWVYKQLDMSIKSFTRANVDKEWDKHLARLVSLVVDTLLILTVFAKWKDPGRESPSYRPAPSKRLHV